MDQELGSRPPRLRRQAQADRRHADALHTEDIPDDLRPVATEHTIHRDWRPACKQRVEPRVPHALPKCTLGVRTLVTDFWAPYAAVDKQKC